MRPGKEVEEREDKASEDEVLSLPVSSPVEGETVNYSSHQKQFEQQQQQQQQQQQKRQLEQEQRGQQQELQQREQQQQQEQRQQQQQEQQQQQQQREQQQLLGAELSAGGIASWQPAPGPETEASGIAHEANAGEGGDATRQGQHQNNYAPMFM